MLQDDIDGVLVGTAALDPQKFLELVAIAHNPTIPDFDTEEV